MSQMCTVVIFPHYRARKYAIEIVYDTNVCTVVIIFDHRARLCSGPALLKITSVILQEAVEAI